MKINNSTDCVKAEEFVRHIMQGFKTEFPKNKKLGKELTINMKWSNSGQFCSGRMRCADFDASCRVSKHNVYPITVSEAVGTQKVDEHFFVWVTERITFNDAEECMIYILGHELWHFLCETKQRKGNHQTKANKNGIDWLEKFRSWRW